MKTGWTIEYVQNLPASIYQDVKDLLMGIYDRQEVPQQGFKVLSKRESMEALLDVMKKRQDGDKT
jgi:hypothetical protein